MFLFPSFSRACCSDLISRSCDRSRADTHLPHQELLVLKHFLLAASILLILLRIFSASLLDHAVHVRFIRLRFILLYHTFFVHLVVQDIIQLLVPGPCPILIVDSIEFSLLVFLEALLNILLLLLELERLAIVSNRIGHVVHQGLNLLAASLGLLFSLLFFLESQAHVDPDLLSFVLFALLSLR